MSAEEPERDQRPGRLKVLVIDDDGAIGHSLQLALAQDCDVATARSAAEVRPLLAGEAFHAVLCDLLLGGENGALLAGKLVAEQPHYRGRVILMTGAMPDPSWAERLAALGHQILAKPFTRVQALAALRRAAG